MTDNNESLGLAGWLFADLLLGLVVIFLAIGFVGPADGSSEAANSTTTSTTTTTTSPTITASSATTTTTLKICPGIDSPGTDLKQQDIELAWATDDPERLRKVIGEFLNPRIAARLEKKGLGHIDPEEISVGYVLAFAGAGPRPSVAEERAARSRAGEFIRQLGVVMPIRFKGFADLDDMEGIKGRPSWARVSKSLMELWYFPKVPSTDCS